MPSNGWAEAISAARKSGAVQSGFACASRATAPATCGEAIDVPSAEVWCSSTGDPIEVPAARAETIAVPGAAISGFTARSPTRGPRLEKSLSSSDFVTLPTASAASAAAGLLTLSYAPKFPAAMTNSVPVSSVRAFTASDIGSVPSECHPPRLKLTATASLAAAHSMPAMIASSGQSKGPHTLPTSRSASGATPRCAPPEAVPRPATVPATCVP